jgi:hypothetical protein
MSQPEPERPKRGRPATGKTPKHGVRMPDPRWQRLGDAAEAAGTDRTEVINDFARWYTHEPGAKAVKRPDPLPVADAEPAADGAGTNE